MRKFIFATITALVLAGSLGLSVSMLAADQAAACHSDNCNRGR